MFETSSAIQWEKQGDITFVRFKADKVTERSYAAQAGKELSTLAERIGGKMILNLSNVKFMASIGISLLIVLNKSVRARGGSLKVCEVSPLLRGILATSGMDSVIDIYPTEAQAIASFRKAQTGEAAGGQTTPAP